MFSLRSLLVAAVAFASFASAVPVASEGLIARDGPLDNVVDAVGGIASNVVVTPSLGDILQTSHDQIMPIVTQIKNIVAVQNFNTAEVGGLIGEIVEILNGLIADIQVIVDLNLGVADLLVLAGEPCSIQTLAGVIFTLLSLVIDVLALVLSLVPSNATLTALISSVGAPLVNVVTIVVKLIPGLAAVLAVLIEGIAVPIGALHFNAILVAVGIAV